jgi:signal transduction histidine kinase
LHGLDKDWVEAGHRRVAAYPQVPAGDYRFQVLACNSDGVWNESGAAVALTVMPNWWESAWFRVLAPLAAVGLLGGGVLLGLRRRHRRQIERLKVQQATERERVRIAQDLHDDLGAELSSIAMLADLAQHDIGGNQAVRSRLDEIIHHARQTVLRLEEIVWAINPTNDTLECFASYLCKFAQRYLELAGVRARFDVPARFPGFLLSSIQRHNLFLAAKEALHNAVRHGRPSEVILRITLCDPQVRVTVEDNGLGFNHTAPLTGGHGSGNMAKRMIQIGGTFERRSVTGQGTVVVLAIPLTDYLA